MWVWPPGLGTECVGAESIRYYQDPCQVSVTLAPCSEKLLKVLDLYTTEHWWFLAFPVLNT
eukprot:2192390-Rhodomonas_salina.1